MNYEDMSDFEINKAVAVTRGMHTNSKDGVSRYSSSPDGYFIKSELECYPFDPVNNPSHAWPIICEACIDIEWPEPDLGGIGAAHKYLWGATYIQVDFSDKTKALRAAMIVFLKMKYDEK